MIVCTTCGTSNRDDERFCGNCGSFLEWEGTPVARTTAEAATTPAAQEPSGGGAEAARPVMENAAQATTGTGTGTVVADGDAVPEREPVKSPDRPSEPIAVQPGVAAHPRRPVRPLDEPRPAAAGEQICPQCRSGNETTRRFCRTCGSRLGVEQVVEAPRSWWQRLLDRLRRRKKQTSPRRDRSAARRLLLIIAVICGLTVVAVGGPPLARRGITEIRDRTQDPVPLRPTGTAASSEGQNTPAARISDGATNRFWAPTGPAAGAWVEASYAKPVRMLNLIVTPGVSTEQEKFLAVGRPEELGLVATRSNGETVEAVIKLRDQPGPQQFKFEASDVVRLRLVVRSTYGPPKSAPTVAIGEVEFFGRK